MRISENILRHKRMVTVVWALAFLAITPLILNYGHFIDYSVTSGSLSNTESGRAQALLSSIAPQNSSLIVVIPAGQNVTSLAQETLNFQSALNESKIPYYSASESAFSDYARFLDTAVGNYKVLVWNAYENMSNISDLVYSFPSRFFGNWSSSGYSQASIFSTASVASYDNSALQTEFLNVLNASFTSNVTLSSSERVQYSARVAAVSSLPPTPYLFAVLDSLNFTNFRNSLPSAVVSLIAKLSGAPFSTQLLSAVLAGGNVGENYVAKYGLLGAPSFLTRNYVSSDNSTYLINIRFNVTESFRTTSNFYPAQNATLQIRTMSEKFFKSGAQVTGQGAVSYDTQSLTSSSGFVFGFTFVFLAIAVAITLASAFSPLVALLFVSLSTGLGYASIYVTGLIFGRVDFTVTYTLTAVILGVATDYLVFILARYREELRKGLSSDEALKEATSKSGAAVLISGVTVAASLGALSFLSDLRTWGPVLFISIILTVALETTLLPAAAGFIGQRLFLKRTIRKVEDVGYKRSKFYRAAKFSERRKYAVVGLIVLLSVPTVYFWFNLPTTYNFGEGLPNNLQSVQALNTINQKFGSDLIYPTFVIVNFTSSGIQSNGTMTDSARISLEQDANAILSLPGVRQVIGPTVNGTNIGANPLASQFFFNDGKNAYFIVFTSFDPYSQQAIDLVSTLRQSSGFLVGGLTSSVIDLKSYYNIAYNQLEILIVVVIALVLGLSFRSLKYPLISLSGVFISITWTTGLLYLIAKYVLNEQLIFLIPIVLFVILLSLGNDFTVFILTRIREEQEKLGFREGLARAMVGSGTVVTALGIILAVSLGSLGLVPFGFLQQIGIAFVISLVLDTFIIRTFYFPAMISLLRGKENAKA